MYVSDHVDEGISPGMTAFLVIVVSFIVSLMTVFVYKKYKHQIYLSCRDTCTPSSTDGKLNTNKLSNTETRDQKSN